MLAYIDCFSGASGDMLLGALIDGGAPFASVKRALAALPVRGWKLATERVMRGPVACLKLHVRVAHRGHRHTPASEIFSMIRKTRLPERVRRDAAAVFAALAEAEGKVHGIAPSRVEFHEVGAVDSIVDVVGTCIALDLLGVERLSCSPLPMSRGTARSRHGLIPVPGPATMELLRGFPVYDTGLEGELVTPTGAAILAALVRDPGRMPPMRIARTGYGAGDRDPAERPNFLRVVLGEAAPAARGDVAVLIETNLDNIPGEDVGYLFDALFEAGALDVFTTPIQMKKSRPGITLSVLAAPPEAAGIEKLLLRETPTFGVRRHLVERTKLERDVVTVATRYGKIRVKVGALNGAILKAAPEYEDVQAAAKKHGVPLARVREAAARAYRP